MHRETRICQVAAVMEGVAQDGALTAEEITRKIYVGLAEQLIVAATGNTVLVLKKLAVDGTIACGRPKGCSDDGEEKWWGCSGSISNL